jgi:hypothetical protein
VFSVPLIHSQQIYLTMKRLALCVSVGIITAISYQYVVANENSNNNVATNVNTVTDVDGYISSMYHSIDFGTCKRPDSVVFRSALYGYLNLLDAGKLSNPDILTICDFSKSSRAERMWVIDLAARKVVINDLVAHGQGSGMEYATQFSNRANSHQSSLGFYVTDEPYIGSHGKSLRLRGMDNGFNSAAYDRDVVVHGADYVSNDFIAGENRLGRSWGCPAVSNRIASELIDKIQGGSCLFIYYPSQKYLQATRWLKKQLNFATIAANVPVLKSPQHDTVIMYETEALKERLTTNRL